MLTKQELDIISKDKEKFILTLCDEMYKENEVAHLTFQNSSLCFYELFKNNSLFKKKLKKGYQNGNHYLILILAVAYYYSFKKNIKKEYECYQYLLKFKNRYAYNNLAIMYEIGTYVEKNISKAIKLYNKSIRSKNYKAYVNLGLLYEEEKDYIKAIELYKSAEKKGYIYASCRIGRMYSIGYGVDCLLYTSPSPRD